SHKSLGAGRLMLPAQGTTELALPREAVGLQVKVVTIERVPFDFELHDLPLPRPPAALEGVRFKGDAPVSAREPTWKPDGSVTLRLDRHTPRGLETVEMTLTFLDADGKPLLSVKRVVPQDTPGVPGAGLASRQSSTVGTRVPKVPEAASKLSV